MEDKKFNKFLNIIVVSLCLLVCGVFFFFSSKQKDTEKTYPYILDSYILIDTKSHKKEIITFLPSKKVVAYGTNGSPEMIGTYEQFTLPTEKESDLQSHYLWIHLNFFESKLFSILPSDSDTVRLISVRGDSIGIRGIKGNITLRDVE
jgi:uncharacterized protein YxeA